MSFFWGGSRIFAIWKVEVLSLKLYQSIIDTIILLLNLVTVLQFSWEEKALIYLSWTRMSHRNQRILRRKKISSIIYSEEQECMVWQKTYESQGHILHIEEHDTSNARELLLSLWAIQCLPPDHICTEQNNIQIPQNFRA